MRYEFNADIDRTSLDLKTITEKLLENDRKGAINRKPRVNQGPPLDKNLPVIDFPGHTPAQAAERQASTWAYRNESPFYKPPPELPNNKPDAKVLIDQLNGPRFADRKQASDQLDAIGKEALKDLRTAAKESRVPEIKTRATYLVDLIENRPVLAPGKPAIMAREVLQQYRLPDNWEESCDKLLAAAKQIPKQVLTDKENRLRNSDPLDDTAQQSIIRQDLDTLEKIVNRPNFECVNAIFSYPRISEPKEERAYKLHKGIDLMIASLENGEITSHEPALMKLVGRTKAYENDRFLRVFGDALAKSESDRTPPWTAATLPQVKTRLLEMIMEEVPSIRTYTKKT